MFAAKIQTVSVKPCLPMSSEMMPSSEESCLLFLSDSGRLRAWFTRGGVVETRTEEVGDNTW